MLIILIFLLKKNIIVESIHGSNSLIRIRISIEKPTFYIPMLSSDEILQPVVYNYYK